VITGTLTNTATGESIEITYSPAQDEEVSSISEIIIMADQAIALADEDNYEEILGNIYVQNLAGDVKTNIVDYESLYAEDDEYEEGPTVGLKLVLADTLVAKGNYMYVIPENTFMWGNIADPTYNEDITVSFSIDGTLDTTDNDENLTLTPADGEEVGTLSQIQVGGKLSVNWGEHSEGDITVTDENGEVVATVETDGIEDIYDAELDVAYNDAEIITLTPAITEPGTYTLYIPEGFFYVGDDQNSLSPEITATYTVTGETSVLTYSPAEGEEVDAINSISITANQNVGFLLDDETLAEANITVKDLNGEVVATVVDYESIDNQDEVDADETGEVELITNGVKLILDKTITAAGQYHYLIPDSILTWGDARQARAAGEATYNEAITITFRVTGALEVDGELTCDPADGSIVASLETITVSCEDGVAPSYSGDEITITVNGEAYTGTIDCEPVEPEGDFDPYIECTITLSDAITTEGTVVVTIPEGYFIYGENDANSEEIVLNYTIDSTATGINGVTLNTNGNNLYYNLNGQRVSSPTKGIYILNGKKILVK
ncbi:MAG: hypothetical protein LUC91_02530, partial [Prevotella sp.]|nr:hypothetical protein [Prevotella sp.]